MLATSDLDGVFERVQAAGAEVMQEPTDQAWSARDCRLARPAGNMVRIQGLRDPSRDAQDTEVIHNG